MIIFGQNLALLFSYLNFNIFNLNYSINKIKTFSYKYSITKLFMKNKTLKLK